MKNLVIGASIFAIGAIFGGFSSYWLSVGYEKFGFHKRTPASYGIVREEFDDAVCFKMHDSWGNQLHCVKK
ncbi:MAG: hypothetical protein KAQ98_12885 [Bacteriovoracaceae bacterium]|nr:hypothetical protein [Bacteriovoracaceae bacterium]